MFPSRCLTTSVLPIVYCLLLAGCGGAGSGGTTTTVPPTITSLTVSCALNAVPVGQTNQCSATVRGMGSFNSSVSWSVNGVQGGNVTVGAVNSSGLYVAPSALPTPYAVNVSATSDQDGAKSAFVSVIVAGTLASESQTVIAASGGTITLADGSSVYIPPNILSADQNVTLSEMSAPSQPPNRLIVGVGPTLLLAFSSPIQPNLDRFAGEQFSHKTSRSYPNGQTSSGLTFTVSEATAPLGLNGSNGLAALTDTSNNVIFEPVTYSVAGQTAQLFVPYSTLTGMQTPVSSVAVAPANTIYQAYPTNLPPAVVLPASLCWRPDTSSWIDFTANCANQVSNQKVLVIVHGMMSCVEQFGTLASYAPIASHYDLIVGFDYDWTQHLTDTGTQLAGFLQELRGASKIDIIAHSEGVPVSLYAASQSPDRGLIKNFIGLAGPIVGTPLGNDLTAEAAVFLDYRGATNASVCPASQTFQSYGFLTMMQSPFIGDLQKDSSVLTKTILPAAQSNLSGVTISLGGGTNQGLLSYIYQFGSPFGTTPNDGIVGLDSALGFNSGLVVYPLPPFPLFHTLLPSDTSSGGVLDDVASQLNASQTMTLPQITCASSKSDCEGEPQTQFTFTGTGFSGNASNIEVFSQDSNGAVTASQPSLDDGGAISWTELGSPVAARFSIFSFDNANKLARACFINRFGLRVSTFG